MKIKHIYINPESGEVRCSGKAQALRLAQLTGGVAYRVCWKNGEEVSRTVYED